MWGEAGVNHVDEMGWSMKEIGELQHNVKYMTNHNEIVQNQFKILQRPHLVPFGFPLKDLKFNALGFLSTWKDSAAEKAKKFNDDWLSVLGVQKGLTGLAKDSSWMKMLTYHSRSVMVSWCLQVDQPLLSKPWIWCHNSWHFNFNWPRTSPWTIWAEKVPQRRLKIRHRWRFFCWKGYHNTNGPLVDAIKEVRQNGKRWQMSLA